MQPSNNVRVRRQPHYRTIHDLQIVLPALLVMHQMGYVAGRTAARCETLHAAEPPMNRAKHRQSLSESAEQLLGLIYDAAEEPEVWPTFLERLAVSLNGTAPLLTLADRGTDAASLFVERDCDPSWRRAYDAHFIRHDCRRTCIQRLSAGSVFRGADLLPDAVLLRSEFYSDFLRPQGFFQIAGGIPLKDRERVGVLRVLRSRRQRCFDADDLKLLRLLVPHVGRALRLHRKLATARGQAATGNEVLDWFPTGVILLSRSGHVLTTNRAASAILARRDGLAVGPRRLCAADQHTSTALQTLIWRASNQNPGPTWSPVETMRLARPSGARPLDVLVAPVRSSFLASLDQQAVVVVFVADPEDRIGTPVEIVACYLGLTFSEAKLVLALAQGKTLQEAADEFGISAHTALTQRKSAMAKTGVRRQSELVRLVLSSPAPLVH